MKAIVYTEYGGPDVLRNQVIKKPLPIENEVLVRVHAVSVNYGDLLARNFRNIKVQDFNMPILFLILARFAFGIRKPRIRVLGNAFAGEIESVGRKVTNFGKGDAVFGYTGEKMGAYAEYLCMPANSILAIKPSGLSFEEASAIPYGSIMALNLLRKVNIRPGHKVLVIGASGSIGSAAVQLAKNYYGADVTGVCSTKRMLYVKNLGADKVLDYEKDDFTKSGDTYDLIFDVLGIGSFSNYKSILNKNGICLYASFKTKKIFQMIRTSLSGHQKAVCAIANPGADDLAFIKKLIEEGKVISIIDKCYPPEQAAEAHKYLESKMGAGAVVISFFHKI